MSEFDVLSSKLLEVLTVESAKGMAGTTIEWIRSKLGLAAAEAAESIVAGRDDGTAMAELKTLVEINARTSENLARELRAYLEKAVRSAEYASQKIEIGGNAENITQIQGDGNRA